MRMTMATRRFFSLRRILITVRMLFSPSFGKIVTVMTYMQMLLALTLRKMVKSVAYPRNCGMCRVQRKDDTQKEGNKRSHLLSIITPWEREPVRRSK